MVVRNGHVSCASLASVNGQQTKSTYYRTGGKRILSRRKNQQEPCEQRVTITVVAFGIEWKACAWSFTDILYDEQRDAGRTRLP